MHQEHSPFKEPGRTLCSEWSPSLSVALNPDTCGGVAASGSDPCRQSCAAANTLGPRGALGSLNSCCPFSSGITPRLALLFPHCYFRNPLQLCPLANQSVNAEMPEARLPSENRCEVWDPELEAVSDSIIQVHVHFTPHVLPLVV